MGTQREWNGNQMDRLDKRTETLSKTKHVKKTCYAFLASASMEKGQRSKYHGRSWEGSFCNENK